MSELSDQAARENAVRALIDRMPGQNRDIVRRIAEGYVSTVIAALKAKGGVPGDERQPDAQTIGKFADRIDGIAGNASLCDSAEALEEITTGLLALAEELRRAAVPSVARAPEEQVGPTLDLIEELFRAGLMKDGAPAYPLGQAETEHLIERVERLLASHGRRLPTCAESPADIEAGQRRALMLFRRVGEDHHFPSRGERWAHHSTHGAYEIVCVRRDGLYAVAPDEHTHFLRMDYFLENFTPIEDAARASTPEDERLLVRERVAEVIFLSDGAENWSTKPSTERDEYLSNADALIDAGLIVSRRASTGTEDARERVATAVEPWLFAQKPHRRDAALEAANAALAAARPAEDVAHRLLEAERERDEAKRALAEEATIRATRERELNAARPVKSEDAEKLLAEAHRRGIALGRDRRVLPARHVEEQTLAVASALAARLGPVTGTEEER